MQSLSLCAFAIVAGLALAGCASDQEPPGDAASPEAPYLDFGTTTQADCHTLPVSGLEKCLHRRGFGVGTTGTAMSVGDANGDGLADVAVASSGPDRVEIVLDLADDPVFEVVELPGPGQGVVFSDLDGDATVDMAIAYYDWSADAFFVQGVFGQADGTFEHGDARAVPRGPITLSTGELDASVGGDIVVTSALGTAVTVLGVDGSRAFVDLASFSLDGDPTAAVLADLGGDGPLDLSVVEARPGDSGLLRVYQGLGDGSFVHVDTRGTGRDPNALTVGDFDADPHPDIALLSDVETGALQIGLGRSGTSYSALDDQPASGFPHSVAHGDLDGDGHADLAVVAGGSPDVLVLAGTGVGTFSDPVAWSHGVLDPVAVEFAYVDSDEHLDLVVLGYEGQLAVLLSQP